jgi:3-deoxy-D-manno-octulosonic-acid transferase/heptosyltransferase-1
MNILIIRLSSIGDVVHTLSAVEPLRQHFPGCTITWVVEEKAEDLIKGYPGIDRVIVSRRKQWLEDLHNFKFYHLTRNVREFLKELRRDHYDIIIDFQGLFKSGILAFLARGKRKVGYKNAREASTMFYSEKAPPPDFNDHAIKRHMALIHYLGVKESPNSFSLPFGKEDKDNLEKLFDNEHVNRNKPVVCFHPSAVWATKRLAQEKVARLCDMLQEEFKCQILFVGTAEEKEYLDHICSLLNGEAKNLAGKTSLRELACLVSKSDLMVSMDSGPMHITCAVGTPVVALFGPTAPWRTGPFGDNYSVIRKELPCSPCFKKRECPEGHHRCMNDITVEDVFKVCCNYLER